MIRGRGGWWSLSVLLYETVDAVLRSFIVRHHFKDIGKTEQGFLCLTISNNLQVKREISYFTVSVHTLNKYM